MSARASRWMTALLFVATGVGVQIRHDPRFHADRHRRRRAHDPVMHPSPPVKNVKELIAFANARPGQLNYATAGRGTNGHLAGELLNSMTGLTLEHIAYKGAAPALIDLLAGHVHMEFTAMPFVVPYVRANRLRMLAQTGEKRSRAAADVPTMREAGLPGFLSFRRATASWRRPARRGPSSTGSATP